MQKPAEIDIVRRAYELWEQAESLTAEIRNFIIRQNRNCNKQRNSHHALGHSWKQSHRTARSLTVRGIRLIRRT